MNKHMKIYRTPTFVFSNINTKTNSYMLEDTTCIGGSYNKSLLQKKLDKIPLLSNLLSHLLTYSEGL